MSGHRISPDPADLSTPWSAALDHRAQATISREPPALPSCGGAGPQLDLSCLAAQNSPEPVLRSPLCPACPTLGQPPPTQKQSPSGCGVLGQETVPRTRQKRIKNTERSTCKTEVDGRDARPPAPAAADPLPHPLGGPRLPRHTEGISCSDGTFAGQQPLPFPHWPGEVLRWQSTLLSPFHSPGCAA